MGEGKHLATSNAGKRWIIVVSSTAAAVVAAVVLMQSWKAQPGQAATEAQPAAKPAARKPEVLARVGKESIPYDLVAQECIARHGKEILDDLINRVCIKQACEARGLVITEEEVTAEINRIAKRFNLDPQAWYSMLQAERNITPQQYRQSVIWPMLALRKLAGETVEVEEEELNQAFVRNYGQRVKVRMIMLNNMRQAQECWEQTTTEDFEKLAQKYSVDAGSRALGGSVPPIPRYSGNDDIEKAAFKLKEGEVSGIIQLSGSQYVILKCEGRTEQIVTDIEEVRDSLVDEIKEAKTQQAVAKVFEKIKKDARIDNYLTATSTGPDRPTGAIQQTSGVKTPVKAAADPAAGRATLK